MAVGLVPEVFIGSETIEIAPDTAAEICMEGMADVVQLRKEETSSLKTSIENMDLSKPGNAATQAALLYFVKASDWQYASSERRSQLGYWQ